MATPDPFGQEMGQLEVELKRLESEYSQFFAGSLKRMPIERRRRVEATIRRHDRATRQNTAERFRFETLQARFASLSQLWDRTLRDREK